MDKPHELVGKCVNVFAQKPLLSIYLRVHRDEKLYICSECGKAFIQNSELIMHEKIHTRENPINVMNVENHFSRCHLSLRHQTTHTEKTL